MRAEAHGTKQQAAAARVSPELFQSLFTASRLQLSKVMNVAAPPHHTITATTTTLLALAWHAINPASPSHEPLARKGGAELWPLLENAYNATDVRANI